MYVRYVKVLQRTSAPVIIDATFQLNILVLMNRSLITIRTGSTVKNFSSHYKVVHLASITVQMLISNKSR